MLQPEITRAARLHISRMLRVIGPKSAAIERRFRSLLRNRKYATAAIPALCGITPAAASMQSSLDPFLAGVRSNGAHLARLNFPPEDVNEALSVFDELLAPALEGRFAPAREQLRLATTLALNDAFYQVREAEARALFDLGRAEMESEGAEEMLACVVAILARAFGARAGRFSLTPEGARGRLAKAAYFEHGPAAERLIADERLRGRHGSYWSYPAGDGAVLQFAFSELRRWLPREAALLEAAAGRCADRLRRARLEDEVRRLDAQRRCAEEDERRRIGRELHDEAGQKLLFLRLQLEMAEREADEPLRGRLRDAREIAEGVVVELRRMVAALSPGVLERLGLRAALRRLGDRFRAVHPAELRMRISTPAQGFAPRLEQVIYRVAQECLQNVAKHSGATRVNLSLETADSMVRLRVKDNGAGFSPKAASIRPASFGLAGMRERAGLIGGTLSVRSAPGKGATVVLELPGTARTDGKYVKDSCSSN